MTIMKKQGYIGMEMTSLEEVMDIINDYRSQGLRFVYNIDGHMSADGNLVHSFTTYGDLTEEMEELCEDDEELWGDNEEYQRLKGWWQVQFKDVPEKKVLRVYVNVGLQAKQLCEALDKAEVFHGDVKSAGGFSPRSLNYYVNVPDEGGAHYLEELINMNCVPELIEKFTIKEV